jgi:acyl-CoA thioester hydrolase
MRPTFFHPLRVRYADTDAQGHVYFANHLTFADEGLSAWMRHIGWSYDVVQAAGVDFVFADAHARYRDRALFEEVLHVHVGPQRVGNTSIVHRFEIVRAADGGLLVEGELVQVCLAMPSREKARVPEALREAINVHGGVLGGGAS